MYHAQLSNYTNSRDNNFNLIRFVAALLVLYSHSFVVVTGMRSAQPLQGLIGMTWGDIAVDIFFVISGFLVTRSFFERKNIIAFARSRILRVYPALIAAVLFCTFVVGLFFTSETLLVYLSSTKTYHYLLKNMTLLYGISHYLPGLFADLPYKGDVNTSLWTLPYEMKLYAMLGIFGFILFKLQKYQRKNLLEIAFLILALAVALATVLNHIHPFVSPYFLRFFTLFFAGSIFYVFRSQVILSWKISLIASIILLLSIFYKELLFFTYAVSLTYLVVYLAYIPAGTIRRFNQSGDYSYGIYIYAWPIQQSIIAMIPQCSITAMVILSFGVTLIFAYLSWHLIEKRFLSLKNPS